MRIKPFVSVFGHTLSGLAILFATSVISADDVDTVDKARKELGCSSLTTATEIAERLPGQPSLYLCYRGREMEHQKLSYVEFSGSNIREFASRESFAARFAPFDTSAKATALAMAFTQAQPVLRHGDKTYFKLIQAPHKGTLVTASGGGHRVILYETVPQQGHCEVPGIDELVIQTWPDGLKRQIRRTKIYERGDRQKICVD